MITKPILPWEYKVLAFVADPGHITPDTALVITERKARPHPYALHRMNLHTGDCYYGHYHETYASALEALIAKLGVGNDAPDAEREAFEEGFRASNNGWLDSHAAWLDYEGEK